MALAITDLEGLSLGNKRGAVATLAFDSSYPTGGESLTPADLGLTTKIDYLSAEPIAGFKFQYDRANSKLKAFTNNILIKGGQAAAGTAAAAYYATDILGKEAATDKTILGTAASTKGGIVGAEVANTTDLSAVTGIRVFAVGV